MKTYDIEVQRLKSVRHDKGVIELGIEALVLPRPGHDALARPGCWPRLGGLSMACQLAHASPAFLLAAVSRDAVQSVHRPAIDR